MICLGGLCARRETSWYRLTRRQVVRRRNYRLGPELVLRAPVGGELQDSSVQTSLFATPLLQEISIPAEELDDAVRNLRRLILGAERDRHAVSVAIGLGTTESQAVSALALHGERGQSELARDLQLTSSASTGSSARGWPSGPGTRAIAGARSSG